jgi:hypothetical protein
MTPFALTFMTVSMVSVTALAGFCFYRILMRRNIDPDDE